MKKRFFILSLLLCLALTLLPMNAQAAEVVASGSCGENVTWTLTEDGTLNISGTGPMTNNSYLGQYSSRIKTVNIREGVTSIGDCAFDRCYNLSSITLPDSITNIGNYAFSECRNLNSITLPDSVTNIGDGAFVDCEKLNSIAIPKGVMNISDGMFYRCANLSSIIIPDGITSIGDAAFRGCEKLNSIIIPDSVLSIGASAFHGCRDLYKITIPDSVTNIGGSAFRGCEKLSSITIPKGVTSIEDNTFYGCISLNNIILSDTVTSIGVKSFYYCQKLTNITLESVVIIGHSAFESCTSLSYIILPDSLETIRNSAFYDCPNLKDVYFAGSEEAWNSIRPHSIYDYLASAEMHYNSAGPDDAATDSYPDDSGNEPETGTEPVTTYCLEVYSQDNTFSLQVGEEMFFDVYLLQDGSELSEWNCPTVELADGNIGTYAIEKRDEKNRVYVTGTNIGQTQITITDSVTGATIQVPMTVLYNLNGVNSYLLDTVPEFYPDTLSEGHLLTNFYNHRGIYINGFDAEYNEEKDCYHVTMNAYNLNYYHGAIDVYDKNGNWIKCYQITKFSDISSMSDMVDYVCKWMDAGLKFLAYNSGTVGMETKLAFDVPAGGFFAISNNVMISPGTFLYNMCDITLFCYTMMLDIADVHADMNMGKEFADQLIEIATVDEAFQSAILDLMWDSTTNISGEFVKKIDVLSSMEDTLEIFYEMLTDYVSVENILTGILDVDEAVLTNLGGPAGFGIDTIFTASKYNNYLLQTACMITAPYTSPIYISSRMSGQSDSIFGVEVVYELPERSILQVNHVGTELDKIIDIYVELAKKRTLSQYACKAYNIQVIVNNSIYIPDKPMQVRIQLDDSMECIAGVLHQADNEAWQLTGYQIIDSTVVMDVNSLGKFALIYEIISTEEHRHNYKGGVCTRCGEKDPEWTAPTEPTEPSEEPSRIAGSNRFETANLVGDQMKKNLGIEKFDAVVVASGTEFADALAGSYLAAVKNAPILLAYTTDKINDGVKDYIRANLKEGGTVYILGGPNAVPTSFEANLEGFEIKRLQGANRYMTNLEILKEAGAKNVIVSHVGNVIGSHTGPDVLVIAFLGTAR